VSYVKGAPFHVFIVGADNQVYSESANASGGWNGWTLTQPGAVQQISVTMGGSGMSGTEHVFAIGMDNQVWYENHLSNGSWSGWSLTQPGDVQQISAVIGMYGVLDVFAIGTDGQVWTATAGDDWNGWTLTQPGIAETLSANSYPDDIFVIGLQSVYFESSGVGVPRAIASY
jgi:hypothetical protein